MVKKKKRKVKKSLIVVIIFIIVIVCLVLVPKFFKKKTNNGSATQVEVIDSIDSFGYQLNDNETKYYNELFFSLKELLQNDDYSEEEYAVIIGKLFLADFYDLNSKVMKSDVGGTQFVYSDYRSDFESGAIDTVYKFIESNVYGDRKQNLPVVKRVEMVDVSNDKFKYGNEVDSSAYFLTMEISYEKDLGYPKKVSLVLIHNNDRLEIARMDTIN